MLQGRMATSISPATRRLLTDCLIVCALFGSLCLVFPVARAAAHLTAAYAITVWAFTAGTGEASGRAPPTLAACLGGAALSQLLPWMVGTPLVLASCAAICVLVFQTAVCIRLPPLPRLDGHVVVVTGSSTGIGEATAELLLGLGATVVFACRTESRARAAMERTVAASGASSARAVFVPLDLSSCVSIRECASIVRTTLGRCDALVCNAGSMHMKRTLTKDGWEANLACHVLGNHLLSILYVPLL